MDWRLNLPNGIQLEADMKRNPAVTLIVFELMSLREINEGCGREAGDLLLMAIRDYILSLGADNISLYRISGPKFCIAIQNEETNVIDISEKISARFIHPWRLSYGLSDINYICAIAMGIIPLSMITTSESLLNIIERVLKSAENAGSIVQYDKILDQSFRQRRILEFSLKNCVANDMKGFEVYYQPIVDPVTGIWCGLEALCRWVSPEIGQVSPAIFIEEAERLNLIGVIGLWVLETAVRQCKEWGLEKLRKFILDINVSAKQFFDARLAEKIIEILQRNDFPGEKLCLEITESTQFTFGGLSLQTIEKIKMMQVSVALDDFGTGYSALNKLRDMPVDIVKIERVFVTGIENDSYLRYLFRAISELVHAANMRLIAEGVENMAQMDILLKSGADFLQGYLFSKPIRPEEMLQYLCHFHESDRSVNIMQKQKIDLSRLLSAENDYTLTPALSKLMNKCIHILLYGKNASQAIQDIIAMAGKSLDVSRSYVFIRDAGAETYTNTHEWTAEGVKPQKENLKNIPAPASWSSLMAKEGFILSSDISELPGDSYEALAPQDIKALMVIPLWNKHILDGFIGFDDCREHREWGPEEVLILHNLCAIIGREINKTRMQEEIDMHRAAKERE